MSFLDDEHLDRIENKYKYFRPALCYLAGVIHGILGTVIIGGLLIWLNSLVMP